MGLFGVDACPAQGGSVGFPSLFLGALLGMGKGSEF